MVVEAVVQVGAAFVCPLSLDLDVRISDLFGMQKSGGAGPHPLGSPPRPSDGMGGLNALHHTVSPSGAVNCEQCLRLPDRFKHVDWFGEQTIASRNGKVHYLFLHPRRGCPAIVRWNNDQTVRAYNDRLLSELFGSGVELEDEETDVVCAEIKQTFSCYSSRSSHNATLSPDTPVSDASTVPYSFPCEYAIRPVGGGSGSSCCCRRRTG